jgi:putative hydrolase of the HAD superfamily
MFDLGSTVLEGTLDPIQGNIVLLQNAYNPHHITPDQLQVEADQLDKEIRTLKDSTLLESTTIAFQKLLYDLHGIEIKYSPFEAEMIFWDTAFKMKPTEGIVSLLELLQKVHIRCAIISNITFSGAIIRHELEKHNILSYFTSIICSSDYGFRKPSRKLFEVALIKENCLPTEAWYIGDSLEIDIKGANSASIYPIWYNQNRKQTSTNNPVDQISNWIELENRIKTEL